jgi:hypothetical protein
MAIDTPTIKPRNRSHIGTHLVLESPAHVSR